MLYVHMYCASHSLCLVAPSMTVLIAVLYYYILFHCMDIYLAALLLMEIIFFVVLNLMNIIKIDLLICASLCIFMSFSKVSTGRWDC